MPYLSSLKPPFNIVKAWAFDTTLLESYCYTPQQSEKLPAHYHDEYQFCLSVNYPSEYYYRKEVHFVPIGSLSIIHPGELHSGTGRDIGDHRTPATFRMMYMQPKTLHQVLEDIFEQETILPFFTKSVILDNSLAQLFLRFHQASEWGASQLTQYEQLQFFLLTLIQRYSDHSSTVKAPKQERAAVRKARDYLNEHYAEHVTLKQLAQIANLSPSYFSRVFKAEVGVSLPHYQTQIRVSRAKALLIQGMPIKQVAAETGFVDQSHLSRQFKRFVHVTPGKYG